jgi:hypothetical protein
LREELNRPAPPAAGQRQRGDRPDPVKLLGEHLGPAQVSGRGQQPPADAGDVHLEGLQHLQVGGDLQLAGGRQLLGGDLAQPGAAGLGADRAGAQLSGALVEAHRVDPLDPGGVLPTQVMVELQQRPVLQHLLRGDPAPRDPVAVQQLAQQPGVGAVGLGPPLAAAGGGGVGRLGQLRPDPGGLQAFHHVPPPGAGLGRERDLLDPLEPAQPDHQVLAVGRGDPPGGHLPGGLVEVVERQLLPVDVQSPYDRHRGASSRSRGTCCRTHHHVRLS